MNDDANYNPPINLFPDLEDRFLEEVTSEPAGMDEGRFAPLTAYMNEFIDPDGGKRESRFYSANELLGRDVPPRHWLLDEWIPQKTVTLFGGDGGTGKSLLALQLAVAVATDTYWLGMKPAAGRVIFMSAEDDDDELHRRLDAILAADQLSYDQLEGLTLRSLAGEDALLAVEGQLQMAASELYYELERRAEVDTPTLVVIDTLADVYPSNENDRAKVRQFIGLLRGLALKAECAVVLLGHPSLSGLTSGSGTSGSTAWNNSVRSRLYLERIHDEGYEPDPDARRLSNKKANYGRIGSEIHIKWEAGRFVPDRAQDADSSLDRMAQNAKAERAFLACLDAYTAQGRYVSASPGPTYAPAQFQGMEQSEGCTKRALKAAMNGLFARGEIAMSEHGKGRSKRSHIVNTRVQK